MSDFYSVWQFFPDDFHECVARSVGAEEAVRIAHSCTTRPAAQMGIIRKVIVTDDGDCTCFMWEHDKGVVFPPSGADGKFAMGSE